MIAPILCAFSPAAAFRIGEFSLVKWHDLDFEKRKLRTMI
jgi:hypothetical protein